MSAEIQKLYIAYFNRPADPGGLTYWTKQLAGGASMAQIANSFSASAEYQAIYNASSNFELVVKLYQNLFGRTPLAGEASWWSDQITTNGAVTITTIANQLASGTTPGSADHTAITNKISAATTYTAAIDTTEEIIAYKGTATFAKASAWLAPVKDAATLATAIAPATLTAAVADAVSSAAASGSTFTLTTSPDNFAGTANNDSFSTSLVFDALEAVTTTSTMSIADILAGGAGTDTFNIVISGAQDTGVTIPAASISAIETINIRNTVAQAATFAATSGLTTAASDRSVGAVVFSGLAAGAVGSIIGDGVVTNGASTFGYAATVTSGTVNLSGGTLGTPVVTTSGTLLAAQTVNSTGAANVTGALTMGAAVTSLTVNATTALTTGAVSNTGAAALTTLTVTGAGAVSFGSTALEATVATIDASGNSGGVTVTPGSLVTATVTGGSGNDVITTGAVLSTGSVNAGAGTDTLVVASATHLASTTLGAKYTNFETLRIASTVSMDMANAPAGITAVQTLGVATASNMTPTQAANVTMRTNAIAGTADAINLQLASQSGTSDVLTITAGTGLTTTGALDIAALNVTGFETLNLRANPGPSSTAGGATTAADDRTTFITGTITGPTLNAINLTGTAVNIANVATTVAVTINGSALTGNGLAAATTAGLTVAGSAVAGSTITGSAVRDVFTIGAEGSAYNGGDGNDSMTTTEAILLADGTTDGTMNGGAGTDTMVVSDTTTTLNDNHFIKLSNFEGLTLSNTIGDASITIGGGFNSAFANGATIATGTLAVTKDIAFLGGLATVPITLTVDATLITGAATDVQTIVTGSAADTVTFTGDNTYVGVTGDANQGTINISTNAGADTITYTHGQLLANAKAGVTSAVFQAVIITGGTGADTITKGTGSLNSTTVSSVTYFNMAAGDSGTTVATQDKITGFSLAGVATNSLSDVLNFEGTAVVSTFTASVDSGTILSHSVTGSIVTFDTAATFAAAKIINSTNLADAVGYLNTNLAVNETVGFLYDSNSDGANDATMVFHQGSSLTTVADDLVQLVGTTGLSLNATLTTATAGAIAIA